MKKKKEITKKRVEGQTCLISEDGWHCISVGLSDIDIKEMKKRGVPHRKCKFCKISIEDYIKESPDKHKELPDLIIKKEKKEKRKKKMGIRETQCYGLPKEAVLFLEENAKKINECKHCGRFDCYEMTDKLDKNGNVERYGMFNELVLQIYSLKNGNVAHESIQCEYLDSGPMIFLELIIGNGQIISWHKCEIEEVIRVPELGKEKDD